MALAVPPLRESPGGLATAKGRSSTHTRWRRSWSLLTRNPPSRRSCTSFCYRPRRGARKRAVVNRVGTQLAWRAGPQFSYVVIDHRRIGMLANPCCLRDGAGQRLGLFGRRDVGHPLSPPNSRPLPPACPVERKAVRAQFAEEARSRWGGGQGRFDGLQVPCAAIAGPCGGR